MCGMVVKGCNKKDTPLKHGFTKNFTMYMDKKFIYFYSRNLTKNYKID